MNPNLRRSILFGVWSVEDGTRATAMPILGRLLKGEDVKFYEEVETTYKPYAVQVANSSRWNGFNDAKRNSVAIIPLKGLITKEDQYCGPSGTVTLMRTLQDADNNENIISIILDVDSGGGEATNINSVASFIRNQIKKPVFAWYNGLNASAAYGISVGADEIFAAQSTDIIGSIGVFTTVANWKKYYESQGLDLTDVYSKYSTDKNGLWKEAIEGNTEPLQKELLDPFASAFFASVREMRTGIDEKVFTGAVYMSKKAKQLGLIDGQKSWGQMLEYAEEKGLKYQKSISKNNDNINMNNQTTVTKAAKRLGFEALESKDGYFSFTEEQMEQLMTDDNEGEQTVLNKQITAMENRMNALESRLIAAEKSIEANAKDIKAFGQDTSEKQTTAKALEDPANKTVATSGNEKPLTEMEKYGDLMAEYGIFE